MPHKGVFCTQEGSVRRWCASQSTAAQPGELGPEAGAACYAQVTETIPVLRLQDVVAQGDGQALITQRT